MRIRKIRVRKEYRLKFRLFMLGAFLLCFIFIPKSHRSFIVSFFSRECRSYQPVYSRKLNDRIVDYAGMAQATGIRLCYDADDIGKRILAGQLTRVSSRQFKIENMAYSYPYLTRDSRKLLDEIGRRFRRKVKSDGLMGSKFIITSMTRTSRMITKLGRANSNASDNSPHLNGNAFDISYARFSFVKLHVTECDKWYMKEALAEVIWQLREEKRCWATYEKNQGCFHVVAR
jgi:hypothetical protein